MDEVTIAWVCKTWTNATIESSRETWRKVSDMFQGAGLAVYGFSSEAGSDYWTLSDVAFHHSLRAKK
jgi:hypothetical protein